MNNKSNLQIALEEKKKLKKIQKNLEEGIFDDIDFFLEKANSDALNYILEWAAYHGNLELVKKTIIKGANVNCSRCAALQMASRNGYLEIVIYLTELGLLNDLPNANILLEAVENKHDHIVKYMLSNNKTYGCKIFDVNAEYGLALRTAIQMEHIEMIKLLLEHNADVNVLDGLPLIIATKLGNNDIVQLLKHSQ
jgi:ankyrin repeat protein